MSILELQSKRMKLYMLLAVFFSWEWSLLGFLEWWNIAWRQTDESKVKSDIEKNSIMFFFIFLAFFKITFTRPQINSELDMRNIDPSCLVCCPLIDKWYNKSSSINLNLCYVGFRTVWLLSKNSYTFYKIQ